MKEIDYFHSITPEARSYFIKNGFVCVRDFLSPEIVERLQASYFEAHSFRKSYRNTAVQRYQPLTRFSPFSKLYDFIDVNGIASLATQLLDQKSFVVSDLVGAWTSNSRKTYVLPWHRDIRDNSYGFDYTIWEKKLSAREYFMQFNLPVFDDASFWIVPESDSRKDTKLEVKLFSKKPVRVPGQERFLNPWLPKNRIYTNFYRVVEHIKNRIDPNNLLNANNNRARLDACRSYAKTMPDAVEVSLGAGDLLFYRGSGWHTSIYQASIDRFTFFSNIRTEESDDWFREEFLPSREKTASWER